MGVGVKIRQSSLIDSISTVLALGIVYMEIFKNASEISSSIMRPIIGVCGALLSLICFLYYRNRIHDYTYLLIFFAFCMTLMNYFFIGQVVIGRMIAVFIVYLPVALILTFHLESKHLLFIVRLFFGVCTLNLLFTFFSMGNNILLFYKTSRNYISVYITVILFVVSVYYDNMERKVSIWIIIFYFISCVLAIGRGGIIAASMYLILQIYCRLYKEKKGNQVLFKKTILFFFVGIAIIVFAFNFENIIVKYFGNFLINHRNSDNSRVELLKNYLTHIFYRGNIEEFFIGVKTTDIGYLGIKYKGNLHNSVFMFHSYFGIIGMITLIGSIAYAIRYFWKHKKWDMMCIVICIFIRSLSDYFYPGGIGDIFIWYILILFINRRNQLKMKKKIYYQIWNINNS